MKVGDKVQVTTNGAFYGQYGKIIRKDDPMFHYDWIVDTENGAEVSFKESELLKIRTKENLMLMEKGVLIELLRQAAEKGLQVGDKGTHGDYTDLGIGFEVYRNWEENQE